MTDQEKAEIIQKHYNALVVDGVEFPFTPAELAAVMTRVLDGTITRASARIVLDELEKQNRAFIAGTKKLVQELKNT